MNTIVDFYKGLDALNLIIFWGVIIVLILLIIFSILLINKNKKIKEKMLIDNQNKENNYLDIDSENNPIILPDIPKEEQNTQSINEQEFLTEPIEENKKDNESVETQKEPVEISQPIEEEKVFVAEEHVMAYNNDLFTLPTLKKATEYKEEPLKQTKKEEFTIPTKPYERNVLREMSLNQTSPIGIVKKSTVEENTTKNINQDETKIITNELLKEEPKTNQNNNHEKTIEKYSNEHENIKHEHIKETNIEKNKNTELSNRKENLTKKTSEEINKTFEENKLNIEKTETYIAPSQVLKELEKEPDIETTNQKNSNYLKEVSQKLSSVDNHDDIDRTEYEIKQEEDAIISYKELMEKKDSIETIDEEDAVISIDELYERKKQEEKLYNLTENEADDDFLSELKKFRSDL